MSQTPEQKAIAVAQVLSGVLGLTAAVSGAGNQWEIQYHAPNLDQEFPPMKIDGEGLLIPKGSPQVIVDLLLTMSVNSTPSSVH